jgi:ubiquinone/menaquinone biosynthesis C-methylase UbiE
MNANADLAEARRQAQAQWNANPCGALPTFAFDQDFFSRVEAERYRQQYWQKDFFDYASCSGGRVLEIGVGLGTDLKQFARHGASCHGVDITDRHLQLARRNFELEGYPVELRKSDATSIDFPDGYFDCVYSFGVIHHIPDVQSVLREVHRVLKPGGTFQVAVYHAYSVHTLSLFMRALVSGRLAKLGVAGVLSTIELGADGEQTKPYVKLYTRSRLRTLLQRANFGIDEVGIRQVNFDGTPVLNVLRTFERALGWYVCAKARKPLIA